MKLATAIEEYIAHKRSLGMLFNSNSTRLKAFLSQLGDMELNQITPEQVRTYLDGSAGPITAFWFAKFNALKGFFRFAVSRGHLQRSLLPASMPQQPAKFSPYIYSTDDVRRLLDAVESRYRSVWLLEPHTIRTLLLLLYGTGLRIGEATRLTLADLDLRARVLTIRETKFFKSRLVPVGEDLGRALDHYYRHQWADKHPDCSSPLLSTRGGKSIRIQTAELVFRHLRSEARICRTDGARYQPRLHDFRHTFAVTRLVTWYQEGKDVQRLLPHLSTYLGHVRIAETSRYLTMTKELLQEASRCFEFYARPEDRHD